MKITIDTYGDFYEITNVSIVHRGEDNKNHN